MVKDYDWTKEVKVYDADPSMFIDKFGRTSNNKLFDVVDECYSKNQYGIVNILGKQVLIHPNRLNPREFRDEVTKLEYATKEVIAVFHDMLRQEQLKALIAKDRPKYLEMNKKLDMVQGYSVDPRVLDFPVIINLKTASDEILEVYGLDRHTVDTYPEGSEIHEMHRSAFANKSDRCVILDGEKAFFIGGEHPDVTELSRKNDEWLKEALKYVEGPTGPKSGR